MSLSSHAQWSDSEYYCSIELYLRGPTSVAQTLQPCAAKAAPPVRDFTDLDLLAVDYALFHPHGFPMRKIIVYAIGATASLFILGYTVHMFLGGLVSAAAEHAATAIVVGIGAVAIGWMTWDIIRRK